MARRYIRRRLFPEEVFRTGPNTFFTEMADAMDEVLQDEVDDKVNAIPLLYETYPFDFISVSDTGYDTYEGKFCHIDEITGETTLLTNDDLVSFDTRTNVMLNNRLGFSFFNPNLLTDSDYREIYANLGYFYWENGTSRFIDFFAYTMQTSFIMEQMWAFYNPAHEHLYEDPANSVSPVMLPESHSLVQTSLTAGDTCYEKPKSAWTESTVYPTSHVNIYYDLIRFPNESLEDLRKFFYYVAPLNMVLHRIVKRVEVPTSSFLMTGEVERKMTWVL